jgi:hypothetical protein
MSNGGFFSAGRPLLRRAGVVFSLAGKLGEAICEEARPWMKQIPTEGWDRHASVFNEFCDALFKLSDVMQQPPEGFESVAKQLLKAAQIARDIRSEAGCRTPVAVRLKVALKVLLRSFGLRVAINTRTPPSKSNDDHPKTRKTNHTGQIGQHGR